MVIEGGIPAGESKEFTATLNDAEVWPIGGYQIRIKADADEVIPETDDTNNESELMTINIEQSPY